MKRLQEIKKNIYGGGSSLRSLIGGSPFVAEILAEVLRFRAKLPHLETYDGSTNPDEHVYYFMNTMQLHNFNDAILYKTFSITLKGVSRTWFNQLPSATITSFSQLVELFQGHFMASRPAKRDTLYLFTVKQKGDESLMDCLGHFIKPCFRS